VAGLAPAGRAGATILSVGAAITFSGSDDGGAYSIDVFSGPISPGPGLDLNQHLFRQNTDMGFHGPSNQLDGFATVDVVGNTITVGFHGQAQPGSLNFDFKNPALSPDGQITDVGTSTAGVQSGVNLALKPSFTGSSVTGMGFFLLGFQPGTNVSQTATLTLGAIPEPSTFALVLSGVSLTAALRRRRAS